LYFFMQQKYQTVLVSGSGADVNVVDGGAGAEVVQEGDGRGIDGVLASHRIKSSCFPATGGSEE
jgi:hypothetical protein